MGAGVGATGSFFVMADTSAVRIPAAYATPGTPRDYAFCRFLTKEIGVAAIPPSAFMSADNVPLMANYARFAFCKKDETLQDAVTRLQKLRQYIDP